MSKENNQLIPLLITRGIIVFPGCNEQLDVGRVFSINAVSSALSDFDGKIIIVSQKDPSLDVISNDSIYSYGSLCTITSVREQKSLYKIKVASIARVKLKNVDLTLKDDKDYLKADFDVVESVVVSDPKLEESLIDQIINMISKFSASTLPPTLINRLQKGISAEDLTNQLSQFFPFTFQDKEKLLEEVDVINRLEFILDTLEEIKNANEIEKSINRRVRDKTDKQQREFILREKLRATQDELNEVIGESEEDEEQEILKKLEEQEYPEEVKKKIKKEFQRYKVLPAASLEASMAKTYIDWLVDLPWSKKTEDNNSLENVVKVLDEDHYGLEKVKERIVEYLAVKQMTNSLKAPIICLYGPPGVGKTSLAKSVARALGRKFVKASLGGLYDEAELRGHRRTYVGAMPGKIIKGIKNAGVCNPVFLLDEIDKMASSNKGDPSSALLEILDPEQNIFFQDNYIEENYDLSNVLFICTANYLQNIPAPLRDRLELIELNSYTDIEKMNIAKTHLINKQEKANGLKEGQISFSDESIQFIIDYYTREAGVRELERQISSICRKAVVEFIRNPSLEHISIDVDKVKEYLGTYKYEYSKKEKQSQVGVVTGLAYTEFGGDILPIEVNYFEGKGELVITGNLGNVMKESATIAIDYVKANAKKYGIDPKFFENHGIHIHVPEGAVPKDGPSAGIALTTCVISSLTNTKVKANVAMTGEVNLRGQALPIGGLKEKSLAALRSGLKTIIIPRDNQKDLADLPHEVKAKLEIILMDNVDDALEVAFEK
ncbi:MAG: endopeptidase La [Bacillales bacterium]|nr:endopeptidase La [Bacillales bacterium]